MKAFLRIVSLVTLAGFVLLTAVQVTHHHKDVQAQTNCDLCKIVHQSTPLTHTPDLQHAVFVLGDAPMAAIPHPYLQFVFPSHGRSPPSFNA